MIQNKCHLRTLLLLEHVCDNRQLYRGGRRDGTGISNKVLIADLYTLGIYGHWTNGVLYIFQL